MGNPMTRQQQKKKKVKPIVVDDLLTPDQVSELLGVAKSTLAKWRCTGEKNLPYIRLGGPNGPVRYIGTGPTALIEASPKRGCLAA